MSNKCMSCDRDISSGDIFVKIEIDIHRLIYNEFEGEENFLVPDGPVHMKTKFYICDACSHNLLESSVEDMAIAITQSKTMKINER